MCQPSDLRRDVVEIPRRLRALSSMSAHVLRPTQRACATERSARGKSLSQHGIRHSSPDPRIDSTSDGRGSRPSEYYLDTWLTANDLLTTRLIERMITDRLCSSVLSFSLSLARQSEELSSRSLSLLARTPLNDTPRSRMTCQGDRHLLCVKQQPGVDYTELPNRVQIQRQIGLTHQQLLCFLLAGRLYFYQPGID